MYIMNLDAKSTEVISDLNFRVSYGWQGNVAENYGPDLIARSEVEQRR